jgi:hypothetical protein
MSLTSKIYGDQERDGIPRGPVRKRLAYTLPEIGEWPQEWFETPDQALGKRIDRDVAYRGPRFKKPEVQAPAERDTAPLTDMEVQAFITACFEGASSVPCCPATVTDQRGEYTLRAGERVQPKLHDLTGLPIVRVEGTCMVQPVPRRAKGVLKNP